MTRTSLSLRFQGSSSVKLLAVVLFHDGSLTLSSSSQEKLCEAIKATMAVRCLLQAPCSTGSLRKVQNDIVLDRECQIIVKVLPALVIMQIMQTIVLCPLCQSSIISIISITGVAKHYHNDNDHNNDRDDEKGQSHPSQNTPRFWVMPIDANANTAQDDGYQSCKV